MPDDENSAGRYRLGALIACCLVLFASALYLRLDYQQGSEEVLEIRADAAKYFTAAFNLYIHGAHSLDRPDTRRAPPTRTDLAPGFPLFLTLFFNDPPDSRVIKPRVQRTQAVLGALTCVASFLLAGAFLPLPWAPVFCFCFLSYLPLPPPSSSLVTIFSPNIIYHLYFLPLSSFNPFNFVFLDLSNITISIR